jgi:hypothetical protein
VKYLEERPRELARVAAYLRGGAPAAPSVKKCRVKACPPAEVQKRPPLEVDKPGRAPAVLLEQEYLEA